MFGEWLAEGFSGYWLTLGLILLMLEALGIGGFLLGAATAAMIQAALIYFTPELGLSLQFIIYSGLTLILTILWWFALRTPKRGARDLLLNDRAAQLIGRTVILGTALPEGLGKIQIGDTFWQVRSPRSFETGTTVRICATEGQVLLLE